eukprot:7191985-Lingulodinium_polyedra.AAC.1
MGSGARTTVTLPYCGAQRYAVTQIGTLGPATHVKSHGLHARAGRFFSGDTKCAKALRAATVAIHNVRT